MSSRRQTVTATLEQKFNQADKRGVSGRMAREDHTHGTPADSEVLRAAGGGHVYSGTLLDGDTVALDAHIRGHWGILLVGDDAARAMFTVALDGTVNLIISDDSLIVANANTAGMFCLGTGVANPVVLGNNTGADYAYTVILW